MLDRAAKQVDVDAASVQFVLQDETLRRDTTVAAKGISINDVTHERERGIVQNVTICTDRLRDWDSYRGGGGPKM